MREGIFRGENSEFNHLRRQLIADHNERPNPYTIIRRFLFGMISLDRNYRDVINLLLFVLPILFYLNVFKTEKILQFWDKIFPTYVIPAHEVKSSSVQNFFKKG